MDAGWRSDAAGVLEMLIDIARALKNFAQSRLIYSRAKCGASLQRHSNTMLTDSPC